MLWALALAVCLVKAAPLAPGQPASAGRTVKGYVALTFDDGPWPGTTERLLDGLDQRGVKATFFLVGERVESMPDTVRRISDSGHQVGLHTWDHVPLTGLSPRQIGAQLDPSRACLDALLGKEDRMFRPPFGFVDETLKTCAGTPLIGWSVDTEDWKDRNVSRILKVVEDECEDGAIFLMHDIFDSSVTAALDCVDWLMEEGYYLVTVEELFALRGVTPQPGQVYQFLPPT